MPEVALPIKWEKQGQVAWEDWWLKREGPVRSTIPGLDDHISFLRYDLEHHGTALVRGVSVSWRLDVKEDGLWLVAVSHDRLTVDGEGEALRYVLVHVWRHGFEVDYDRWGVPRPDGV